MEINLRTLVKTTREKLVESGLTPKALDYYRCGFNAIVQDLAVSGNITLSREFIDDYLTIKRELYENSDLAEWSWKAIRSSAEQLLSVDQTGDLSLSRRLSPWVSLHHPLRRAPSERESSDESNLFALVWRTRQKLSEIGLSTSTLKQYGFAFEALLTGFYKNNIYEYSDSAIEKELSGLNVCRQTVGITNNAYHYRRKALCLLKELSNTGTIEWRQLPKVKETPISDLYQEALNGFRAKKSECYAAYTLKKCVLRARQLLAALEKRGISCFSAMTRETLSDCVTELSRNYTGGLKSSLFSFRTFLRYAFEHGYIDEDLSVALPQIIAPRRQICEGFTSAEIKTLLNAPNRTTPAGKRNYAIMLLGATTGLRGTDVSSLVHSSIDWHRNEISIVQNKTGRALTLPLTIDVGNAIANYLLNARPKSDLPNIFLTANRPYRTIDTDLVSSIVSCYVRDTGLDASPIPRRSFHSFRRSLGNRLLKAKTPIHMLSEMLGHMSLDSAKPYLAADEQGLKACALSLNLSGKAVREV